MITELMGEKYQNDRQGISQILRINTRKVRIKQKLSGQIQKSLHLHLTSGGNMMAVEGKLGRQMINTV